MGQKIIPVNSDTYCVYTPSYYNCTYIIHRNDNVILIDTGLKSSGSDIKKALKTLNLPLNKVKAILLTHWHNDHAAGTSEIKKLTQCITYAHTNEVKYFEKKQSNPIRRLADYIPEHGLMVLFKGLIGDTVPKKVKIDHTVKDGDILFNDFEVIETPGHTAGHVSFYDMKQRTLFAGDSLAVVHNRLRLMANPVTPDKPSSKISILKSLQGRDIDYICPGHRNPLLKNVKEEISRFTTYVENSGTKWPLLG